MTLDNAKAVPRNPQINPFVTARQSLRPIPYQQKQWYKVTIEFVQPADRPPCRWLPIIGCPERRRRDGERSWIMWNEQNLPLDRQFRGFADLDVRYPLQLPGADRDRSRHLVGLPLVLLPPGIQMSLTVDRVVRLFDDHAERVQSVFDRARRVCSEAEYMRAKPRTDRVAENLRDEIRKRENDHIAKGTYTKDHFTIPGIDDAVRIQTVDGCPDVAGVQVLLHYPSPHNSPHVLTPEAFATNTLLDHGLVVPDEYNEMFNLSTQNVLPIMAKLDPKEKLRGLRLTPVPPNTPALPYPVDIRNYILEQLTASHLAYFEHQRSIVCMIMGEQGTIWLQTLKNASVAAGHKYVSSVWTNPVLKKEEYGGVCPMWSLLADLLNALPPDSVPLSQADLLADYPDLARDSRNDVPITRLHIRIPITLIFNPESPDNGVLYFEIPHPQNSDLRNTYSPERAQALDFGVTFISTLVNPDMDPIPTFYYVKHLDRAHAEKKSTDSDKRHGLPLQRYGLTHQSNSLLCDSFLKFIASRLDNSRMFWNPTIRNLPPEFQEASRNTVVKVIPQPTTVNAQRMTFEGVGEDHVLRAKKYFESLRGKRLNSGKETEAQADARDKTTDERTQKELEASTIWRGAKKKDDWYLGRCACGVAMDRRHLRFCKKTNRRLIYPVKTGGPKSNHPVNAMKKAKKLGCWLGLPPSVAELKNCMIKTSRMVRELDEGETVKFTAIIQKFGSGVAQDEPIATGDADDSDPSDSDDSDPPPVYRPDPVYPPQQWHSIKPSSTNLAAYTLTPQSQQKASPPVGCADVRPMSSRLLGQSSKHHSMQCGTALDNNLPSTNAPGPISSRWADLKLTSMTTLSMVLCDCPSSSMTEWCVRPVISTPSSTEMTFRLQRAGPSM